MTVGTGTLQDNINSSTRETGTPGERAVAVVNPDGTPIAGSSSSAPTGIFTLPYDTIVATYPTTDSEVYTSKVGGVGGTTQEVVTVTYTDATKTVLSSVVRT